MNDSDVANTPAQKLNAQRGRFTIPLWLFNLYWLTWFLVSAFAVAFDWDWAVMGLVIAFILAETAGILFTVENEGTLTDTTGKYVPEDLTFIFMGFLFWRLSGWLSNWIWIVWALAAWLLQHFIVHYSRSESLGGWNAPRKLKSWMRATLS